MNALLTAIYTAPYRSVSITFYEDDSISFRTAGEVSDDQLDAIIAAGGGNVEGFNVEMSMDGSMDVPYEVIVG